MQIDRICNTWKQVFVIKFDSITQIDHLHVIKYIFMSGQTGKVETLLPNTEITKIAQKWEGVFYTKHLT